MCRELGIFGRTEEAGLDGVEDLVELLQLLGGSHADEEIPCH